MTHPSSMPTRSALPLSKSLSRHREVPPFILSLLYSLAAVSPESSTRSLPPINLTLPANVGCLPPTSATILTLSPHVSHFQYAVAVTHVPSCRHLTVCLRFQVMSLNSPHFPLSYATQTQDNALQIFISPATRPGLGLYVNNVRMRARATIVPGTWHAVCMAWISARGRYYIFLDGKKVKTGKRKCAGCVMEGGGVVVLGVEQDHAGGGFNHKQVTNAHLTHLNFWSIALDQNQLQRLSSCGDTAPLHGGVKESIITWGHTPMAVVGGALILSARTTNHSLSTPSHHSHLTLP